jgi:predicted polyphosphate/ATP-dependent NAD kinase
MGPKAKIKRQSNRVAVIFYPDKIARRKLTAAIETEVMPLGWEPTLWLPTSAEERGGDQALRAIAQGATYLLISGGDGTIREVVEALCLNQLGDKVTLGILPAGTGNVLARNLKIDLNDLSSAVLRALHGNRHPIDLGLVRLIHEDGTRAERVFSVMAGMGLDAKIFEKIVSNIPEVQARGGRVICVCSEAGESLQRLCEHVILVPSVHPLLDALITVRALLAPRISSLPHCTSRHTVSL